LFVAGNNNVNYCGYSYAPRRYVLDAIKSDEHRALPLLKDITELYRIECQAKDRGLTHEQRGYFRHAKAKTNAPPKIAATALYPKKRRAATFRFRMFIGCAVVGRLGPQRPQS
jgi:hypothetical protein